MPKSSADSRPRGFFGQFYHGPMQGAIWGGIAGAVIGTGISLTIGLFYSSANLLIFSVIAAFGVLGALFGHVMSELLADDISLTWRALGIQQPFGSVLPAIDLSDHKTLRTQNTAKMIPNQDIMAKMHYIRSGSASVPPYRTDARIFELIVATAHKVEVSHRR